MADTLLVEHGLVTKSPLESLQIVIKDTFLDPTTSVAPLFLLYTRCLKPTALVVLASSVAPVPEIQQQSIGKSSKNWDHGLFLT